MELSEEQRQKIYEAVKAGKSKTQVAEDFGVHRSTVSRIVSRFEAAKALRQSSEQFANAYASAELGDLSTDDEIIDENVKLAKKVFKLQDQNRVERKAFREHSRVDNMVLELHEAMKDVLFQNRFSDFCRLHEFEVGQSPVGIVQLSDVHFNELIDDLEGNKFNFEIASQRLHKLIRKARPIFLANDVREVVLCLTGDLMNSDRRLDEITAAATNRSRAVFLAVDIIQQVIRDLNQDFNVTVASVTGNESRVGEHVHYSDFLAGDSYDMVIHNMLTYLFKEAPGVNFIPVVNPLECVINVNGNNILLVHGHVHRGIARNPEGEVEKIKARYATRGILISYVLMGHIHCAQISDLYSRSSGLPGANAYSERALNIAGRASQNVYLVHPNFGEIDGVKIDLQNVDEEPMYNFDQTLASYQKKPKVGTVVIQSVTI